MTLQLVITRTAAGTIQVKEMGLGENGQGETLREHEMLVSDPMAAKYIEHLLQTLQSAEKTQ